MRLHQSALTGRSPTSPFLQRILLYRPPALLFFSASSSPGGLPPPRRPPDPRGSESARRRRPLPIVAATGPHPVVAAPTSTVDFKPQVGHAGDAKLGFRYQETAKLCQGKITCDRRERCPGGQVQCWHCEILGQPYGHTEVRRGWRGACAGPWSEVSVGLNHQLFDHDTVSSMSLCNLYRCSLVSNKTLHDFHTQQKKCWIDVW